MSHKTLALLAIAVAAMVATPALCMAGCDETEAAPTDIDCTTYYYDQLNGFEKKIYDGAKNLLPNQTSFTVTYTSSEYSDKTSEELGVILKNALNESQIALLTEQPQLYWIGNSIGASNVSVRGTGESTTLTATINFAGAHASDASHQTLFNEKLDDFVNTTGLTSRYDLVKKIHQTIDETAEYKDITYTYGPRSAYTVIVGDPANGSHKVVCEGYAKTFKLLCDHYDIPCISVIGKAKGYATDTPEDHMWNYVQMDDGNWYFVDCTWDDQDSFREAYLLAGTESMGLTMLNKTTGTAESPIKISASHDPAMPFDIPTLSTNPFKPSDYVTITYVWDDLGSALVKKGVATELPTPESTGLQFRGWNTASDGSGVMYSVGSTPTFTADATLYPIWVNAYNLYFTVNGEVIETVVYTSDTVSVTAPAVPDRAGYTDGHWETYSLTPLGNKTVNAVYTPIHYKATFIAEGVKIAEVDFTMDDETLTEPAIPQKDGYKASWEKYTIQPSDMTINAEYSEDKNILDTVFDIVEKVDPQYISIGALVLGIIVAIAAVAKGRH